MKRSSRPKQDVPVMAYDFQTRLNAVQYALKYGIADASREYGVSKTSIQHWLIIYRAKGANALKQNSLPNAKKLERRVARLEKRLNALEETLETLLRTEKKGNV